LRVGRGAKRGASVSNERPLGRCARPPLGVAAQGGIVTEGHLDDKYLLLLVKMNILNSTIIKYYLTSTQSNIYRLLPS
jgi:hypothetical protein